MDVDNRKKDVFNHTQASKVYKNNNIHYFIDTVENYRSRQRRNTRKETPMFTLIAVEQGYTDANRAMEENIIRTTYDKKEKTENQNTIKKTK